MFEKELFNVSRKAELFVNLLNSIESQYGEQTDSLDLSGFNEWVRTCPPWQKEITCETLILMDRLNDRQGEQRFTPDSPLLSEIHNEVWTHFENLPPEETKAPGRSQVVGEFEKVISSRLELPEATKELFLESVKKPFHTRENIFRKVVGLSPLQGEEDVHKEI